MSQSEKSQGKIDKTDPKRALDLEELGAVSGGEFMAVRTECSDRKTHICIGDPFQCKSTEENKRLCPFG